MDIPALGYHSQLMPAGINLMGQLNMALPEGAVIQFYKDGLAFNLTNSMTVFDYTSHGIQGVGWVFGGYMVPKAGHDINEWAGSYTVRVIDGTTLYPMSTPIVLAPVVAPASPLNVTITSHTYSVNGSEVTVTGTSSRALLAGEVINMTISNHNNHLYIDATVTGTTWSITTAVLSDLMQFYINMSNVQSNIYGVMGTTAVIDSANISTVTGHVSFVSPNGNTIHLYRNGTLYKTGAVYSGQADLNFSIDVADHTDAGVWLVSDDVLLASVVADYGDWEGRVSPEFVVVV